MTAVQSTYTENIAAARAGLLSGSDNDVQTGIAEEELDAGKAAAQGTADKGIIEGGTTATFRGVTIRDVTLGAEQDAYAIGQNVGVVTRGQVWVVPSHDVAANDKVYFTAADGLFTNQASGNVLVAGARWVDTAVSGGFARIYLSGYARVDA